MYPRIPFFHYTYLDNLQSIVKDGRIISRHGQQRVRKEFVDISIDTEQPVRNRLRLLDYIPLFPGFYALYRGYELNGHLMNHYDAPKVQNKSFYGTLNKVLQFKRGIKYENVIIFLVNDEVVYNLADRGKIRYFSDIAVKPRSVEHKITNRQDLLEVLTAHINDRNISGEVDLLDDGKVSISIPDDIEGMIVDNEEVRKHARRVMGSSRTPEVWVSELPRDPPPEDYAEYD